MPDEMFFSADKKSLRRGKRHSPRTETCRPCFVWTKNEPDNKLRGVVMDVSPDGMRVRMIEILPTDTPIIVQMMRDDDFRFPLSVPADAYVVRYESGTGGFTDHGFQFTHKEIKRGEPRSMDIERKRPSRPVTRTRMYTIDYTVGGRDRGR